MKRTFKPVDLLSLAFLLLLSAVAVVFITKVRSWEWLLARYALLSLSVVALSLYNTRSKTLLAVKYLYAFLPLFIILVVFDSLAELIPGIWSRYLDDFLINIDHAVFGAHPTVWLERFINPVLTDILQIAYISYYPMAIALGIVLLVKKKQKEFDEAVFGIVLCFYLSYIGYILFPAIGPRFTLAGFQTADLQASSFTLAIQNTLNDLERNKTDAFPSGHTAVALMTLYYSRRMGEKILSYVLVPFVLALIFSTVYLRYHYVVDIFAGVLLTWITIVIAPKLYHTLSEKSPEPSG
jgi:membrane-associated phospholipid phosphatase